MCVGWYKAGKEAIRIVHSGHGGWSSVHRCVSGGASQNMYARASLLQFLASAAIGRGAGKVRDFILKRTRFNVNHSKH